MFKKPFPPWNLFQITVISNTHTHNNILLGLTFIISYCDFSSQLIQNIHLQYKTHIK